jgi:hypothetical protein
MTFLFKGFMSLGLCLLVALATARAEDAPKSRRPSRYPAEMNKKLADPDVAIQQFVK